MTTNLVILPIVVPMATGALSLLAAARPKAQLVVGVCGLALNLCAAATVLAAALADGGRVMVLQAGDWPAPFGITVVIDPLSALMLAAAALVLLATYIYCVAEFAGAAGGLFHPLFHLLALGVQWSLVSGDLFNLFVAFEIMLMASYALMVLGTSGTQMRQAYKYVLINLLSSTLFVTCCGLVYGHVGTLNLADLARLSHGGSLPRGAVPAVCVLLLVFGLKTAVFPLWFWLPDTYPTASPGIGAVFGGLLTKVGAYVLIRMFVMVFGALDGPVAAAVRPVLLPAAGVTMFLGGLGAVSMNSVRGILSVGITSQVGYMVLAVGLAMGAGAGVENREMAVAGGVFLILHNMVVKSSLFLCGGLMCRYAGTDELDRMGGLARRAPWLAAMFLVAALSLAGLPPLSGFFGKYVLVREALRSEHYALAGVALGASVLTLLSMARIWSYGFWSRPRAEADLVRTSGNPTFAMAGTGALVLASLALGFGAEHVLRAARLAARPIVEPSVYVRAVLGPQGIRPLRTTAETAGEPASASPEGGGSR
jgi:multicomponent Na+:H+ antiporter subunit D